MEWEVLDARIAMKLLAVWPQKPVKAILGVHPLAASEAVETTPAACGHQKASAD